MSVFYSLVTVVLVLQHIAKAQLYDFSTFRFTPCGAVGRFGPSLTQVRQNYAGTTWTQNNAYLTMDPEYPGMQIWTVPVTGKYKITAAGAAGGGLGSGQGAILSGEFDLIAGDKYFVLVGQRGSTGCGSARCSNSGGGGGASGVFRYFPFDEVTIPISSGSGSGIVTTQTDIIYETIPAGSPVTKAQRTEIFKNSIEAYTLIVAGGGGGGNGDASTGDAKDPPNGDGRTWFSTGESTYENGAGIFGGGAYGWEPSETEVYWAGGGAGLLENGSDGDMYGLSTGGQALVEGAAGGKGGSTKASISPSGHGGFGGGGGATAVSAVRGGGGGGLGGGMGGAYNIDRSNFDSVTIDPESAAIFADPSLLIEDGQIDYYTEVYLEFPATIYTGSLQSQQGYGGGGGSGNIGFNPTAVVNPVKEAGYVTIAIISCGPGMFMSNGVCRRCSPGSVSLAGAASCTVCQSGTFSSADSTACLRCALGSYSNAGSSTCTCLAGYGYVNDGCVFCAAGFYKPSSGNSQCSQCPTDSRSSDDRTSCISAASPPSSSPPPPSSPPPQQDSCTVGQYRLNGMCSPCPVGTAKSVSGDSPCTACLPGQYQDSSGATACKSCVAGTFSTFVGATSEAICQSCPLNTFSFSLGASGGGFCTACAPGSTTMGRTGANSNLHCVCSFGFGGSGGSNCIACAVNYYKNTEGNTNCLPCGTNAVTNGLTGSSFCYCPRNFYGDPKVQCTACPLNSFQNGLLSYATDSSVCLEAKSCVAGTYGNPSLGCQPCPSNTYRSGISYATTTINDCISCPIGTTTNNQLGATSVSQCLCSAGFYGTGSSSCTPCPTNTYKSSAGNGGIGVCLPCTANSNTKGLQGATNSDACVCNAGYSGYGMTSCTACSPGSYKSFIGNGFCRACPVGTFQSATGQISCSSCPGSTFQPSEGSSACLQCGTNAIVDIAKTTCSCPENTFGDPVESCTPCPVNFRRPGVTSDITMFYNCFEAPKCYAGYYGIPGNCKQCPLNTYRSGISYLATELSDCILCAPNAGTNGRYGATSTTDCICDSGYFGSGWDSCTACPANTFRSFSNTLTCTECPSGTTTSGMVGARSIDSCLCGIGYFGVGPTTCRLCPVNTYKASVGFTSSCTSCPVNSVTNGLIGASNLESCVCASGYYRNGGGSCEACPSNTYKPNAGNANACTPCPLFSTTLRKTSAVKATECVCNEGYSFFGSKCVPTCPADSILTKNDTTCQCLPGYYSNGTACSLCPLNTFKDEIGNQSCTSCALNGVLEEFGALSFEGCQCAAGYFGDGAVGCFSCPVDTFKPGVGNVETCTKCPLGLSTNGTKGSLDCHVCAADYEGAAPNCRRCTTGTTKNAPGNGICTSSPSNKDITGTKDADTKSTDTGANKDPNESASGGGDNNVVIYAIVGVGAMLVVASTTAIIIYRKRKQHQLRKPTAQESAMAMLNTTSNDVATGDSTRYLNAMPLSPILTRHFSTKSSKHSRNVSSLPRSLQLFQGSQSSLTASSSPIRPTRIPPIFSSNIFTKTSKTAHLMTSKYMTMVTQQPGTPAESPINSIGRVPVSPIRPPLQRPITKPGSSTSLASSTKSSVP